jgi:hypothetical protein
MCEKITLIDICMGSCLLGFTLVCIAATIYLAKVIIFGEPGGAGNTR